MRILLSLWPFLFAFTPLEAAPPRSLAFPFDVESYAISLWAEQAVAAVPYQFSSWDFRSGREITTRGEMRAYGLWHPQLAFSGDSRWLITASLGLEQKGNDFGVYRWPVLGWGKLGKPERVFDRATTCVAVSSDGGKIAVGGGVTHQIYLYDASRKNVSALTPEAQDYYRELVFSPQGRFLYTRTHSAVEIWDLRSQQRIRNVVFDKKTELTSLALSPQGRWLALGWANGEVELWDLQNLRAPQRTQLHTTLEQGALAFTGYDTALAVGLTEENVLTLLSLDSLKEFARSPRLGGGSISHLQRVGRHQIALLRRSREVRIVDLEPFFPQHP